MKTFGKVKFDSYNVDLIELKNNLTNKQIIDIIQELGGDSYIEIENGIIFPTICHNPMEHAKSMKLYYYFNTHLFRCYTDCHENFDIYRLIQRVFDLNERQKEPLHFRSAVDYVLSFCNDKQKQSKVYHSIMLKYARRIGITELPTYDTKFLNLFEERDLPMWNEDGISFDTIKHYNIKYSPSKNNIIIPHYDMKKRLVGIRARILNEEDLQYQGKYMPVQIESKYYSHPLSLNIYGIHNNYNALNKTKKAIICEGEKSVLLGYEYLQNNNIVVAICGSILHRTQILLLLKMGVQEIIIGFDKEYDKFGRKQYIDYMVRLRKMMKKFNTYMNVSFMVDKDNDLDYKDSPLDKGKEIFTKIYNNRIT
jgi:hypothetical protein